MIEDNGLDLVGRIPSSDEVLELAYAGRPVLDLSDESPACKAVASLAEKSGL